MRLTAVWILLGLYYRVISAEDSGTYVPLFVQSFHQLFKGPPIGDDVLTDAGIQTEWIEQKVDNFNDNDTRIWKMRYMINDEFFKEGGPMFIRVGGEWTIKESGISSGHFVDLAKKYNAILFYTEHRFYGESRPFSTMETENLKYLNVQQALADLAHFIEYQRETNPNLENSKVIMSGCSYSASMVTWFRRLYPALIDGGWASSGPLIAKVDFREYYEIVGQSFKTLGGEQCYERLLNGFQGIEKMWADKRYAEIRSMFKLCNAFDEDNDLDMWTFFESLTGPFASIAQYQERDEIKVECDKLLDFDRDDVVALSKYILSNKSWQKEIAKNQCVDVTYESQLKAYKNTTYSSEQNRPWYFQTCNEYGWYQTTKSKNQPFGTKVSLDLFTALCEDIFGSAYTNSSIHDNVMNTNQQFGGLDPGISKIFTVHGALDPWSPIGLSSDKGAVYIPEASHCAAEASMRAYDSPEMKMAKNRIDNLIGQWLKTK